jgi:hypothetical protein
VAVLERDDEERQQLHEQIIPTPRPCALAACDLGVCASAVLERQSQSLKGRPVPVLREKM